MRHWLLGVLDRSGFDRPLPDELPSNPAEAWATVATATGLTPGAIAERVAAHFRLKVADLPKADPRAIRLVPDSFAKRHLVLPLRETDRDLVVATCDPTDLEAEQGLGFASGRTPVFEIAPPEPLRKAVDTSYSPNRLVAALLEGVDESADDLVKLVEAGPAEEVGIDEVEAEPVVKLTNLVLRDAVIQRASDIHFEPGRDGGKIRFRVDGVMRRHMQVPMPALNRVLSRIKIMGHLDIADRLRPQDGRARIVVAGQEYDLRISTVPTREAEKAVIRILNTAATTGLDDVGMPGPELERYRHVLGQRDGIVIVTGPTGSGKSTTLYSSLRELATEEVNIMTVEDPVEYELAGITQIQVEPKRGVTFATALRAILRQDPDVILIGEIRDLETAEVAVQAAMTGHLVLATLHTNDAVGVVQRLVDLGLDRPSIAESLRAVLAQRLVRRLCPHCSREAGAKLSDEEAALAKRHDLRPPRVAVGCETCGQSGYLGRLPVMELLTISDDVRELIVRDAPSSEIQRAGQAGGMRLLDEAALDPVREGLTTLLEVSRELGDPGALDGPGSEVPVILVVDDDAVNRTLARTLLQKNGYTVAEAEDGVEAMARLEGREQFTAVVLDLDMPRMGGREVLRLIRSSMRTAGLPVVVLTGTNDETAEIAMIEAGADDYIRKPLDPPRFVARLKATLRRAAG